jgi:hypothetical protein
MKKLMLIPTLSLMILSCKVKSSETRDLSKFKYEIKGNVYTKGGPHPAIWYTDTISFHGDTVCYQNSDSSIVRIAPPYTINVREISK